MKRLGLMLALVFVVPVAADNVTPKPIVDIDGGKAVLFDDTVSPDGRYAIGWTIRPHLKDVKPVDWKLWNPDDADKFLDTYVSYLPDVTGDKDEYELVDGVIDLKTGQFFDLPTDDPDYPHRSNSTLEVLWGPAQGNPRHVLIVSDDKFSTLNLWVVTLDGKTMKQVNIVDDGNKAVAQVVREKRPLNFGNYTTEYSLSHDDNPQLKEQISVGDSTATIAFCSEVPRSSDETDLIAGTVTLRLSDGKILKATSNTDRDDPYQDFAPLAKADKELNQVYGELSQKLSPAQRVDLKKDQLTWIESRDSDAYQALHAALDDSNNPDPHIARNKALLASTQKRLEELKKRLDQLH